MWIYKLINKVLKHKCDIVHLHALCCKTKHTIHRSCRLMVSLHLSSPPCREVVCSLGALLLPVPLLHGLFSPSSSASSSSSFPHTQPKPHPNPTLTLPRVPSISTGRWLDGTSYLHATPHPWQTTNLHRGTCLHWRVSLSSLAQTV